MLNSILTEISVLFTAATYEKRKFTKNEENGLDESVGGWLNKNNLVLDLIKQTFVTSLKKS